MSEPSVLWDVYNTPRLDPVQFGKFFAADDAARDGILKLAKYSPRAHRPSGRLARQAIRNFATAAIPKIGSLQAAKDKFDEQLKDSLRTPEQHDDDLVNLRTIERFLASWNQATTAGKMLVPIANQDSMIVGGLEVRLIVDFLMLGTGKKEKPTVGGVFLNTQKGDGLGTKPETKARRDKAGETIAILVLQRVVDDHSDVGEPLPSDCWHYYIQSKHVWRAPNSYKMKLKNIEACGRGIVDRWEKIQPPSGFDPKRAKLHN